MDQNKNNPYRPPSSRVGSGDSGPGSPLKAVLYGTLVDIGGTLISGVLIGLLHAVVLVASGISPDQVANASPDVGVGSWLFLTGVLAGTSCSVLGGYVCARVVRRQEYRWGGVMAAISCAAGWLLGDSSDSVAMLAGLLLLTIAAIYAGTWLGVRKNRAASTAATLPA